MPYGQKRTDRGRTSGTFDASWASDCDLGEDSIEPGEEIVMADGQAAHWQCARDAGFEVPGK